MTIALSQNDRQYLEKFVSRKMRPTSRQKAQALLGLAAGEAPERVAQRVGIMKDDLATLVNHFTAEGLEGVGLGRSRTKGSRRSRSGSLGLERSRTKKPGRSKSGFQGKIEKTAGVCGGAARIAGTRIPVWQLVEARNMGVSEAQLLIDYPRLKAVNLVDAWAYALAHPAEIDAEIRANEVA
jgi:uncharacterized protein (DUF433 family)